MRLLRSTLALCLLPALAGAARPLDFYFVDVEGGQATLIVTPAKQSILVDTGWPGLNGRDALRIQAAAKAAGVKKIDYLITSHYHTDHVGGVTQLIQKMPVVTFVDHGENRESGKGPTELTAAYDKAVATGKRLTIKAGDTLPLKAIDLRFVTADGEAVTGSIPGANSDPQNPLCATAPAYPEDKTENARSAGFVLQFGKFRFLNLGDLTLQKEKDLVCPANKLGAIDLYLTTHHGLNTSNAQPLVHAIRPRVALMNNGAKKGGTPEAWKIIRSAPGLEDIWQLHFAVAGGKEHNVADSLIANIDESCEGKYIKVSANSDGSFTVTNSRNKFHKTYAAR